MKKLFFILLILFFSISSGYPYWIWTPKTKRWVNPKYLVKPTPKEQLDFSLTLYQENKLKEANQEFKKLIKYFPKSKEAAEAQYYLGLIEEKLNHLYEAFLEYQKVIDKYPFSERIQEIIERQYKIGQAFMEGKAKISWAKSTLMEHPSIEIFRKVVENSTFGPLADEAQYKLGLVLKSLGRFFEAEEEFQKVIDNYPESQWVSAAKFQIASCKASLSRSPDYDQQRTSEAKEIFEEFLKEHPEASLSKEAEENIQSLKEREAKSNFDIGFFYEKQKVYDSAKLYYNFVIENYPKSIWAAKSLERLQALEKKKAK
ncbi:MAG: outer membrane protein assembly factor BamD [Candidatus Omnitrophica bacterium]|nr:outer membrane protein assembly factor BamD [Candidatus Omnitrophota bacterium]